MPEVKTMGRARTHRIAVSIIFLVHGALFASWVARIPAVRDQAGLNPSELGLALLAMAVGALVAFPATAWLVAHHGSRRVTTVSAVLMCALLPLPALASNLTALAAALALFGAAMGAMDVAMNAQALSVQKLYGRSINSSIHAMFSVGGLAGAAGGGMLAAVALTPLLHFAAAAATLALLTLIAAPRLLPTPTDEARGGKVFALPSRAMLALGLVAFCGSVVEGSIADWSGIYLRDALNTDEGFAAAGYAVFSLAMTVGRLGGDRVIDRCGAVATLHAGAAVAAIALGIALALADPLAALIGFAVVGVGMAVVFPLAFSASGQIRVGTSGSALAAVATMGYSGGLIGPPFIGFAAHTLSLVAGLAIVVVLCAAIAVLARAVAPAEHARHGAAGPKRGIRALALGSNRR